MGSRGFQGRAWCCNNNQMRQILFGILVFVFFSGTLYSSFSQTVSISVGSSGSSVTSVTGSGVSWSGGSTAVMNGGLISGMHDEGFDVYWRVEFPVSGVFGSSGYFQGSQIGTLVIYGDFPDGSGGTEYAEYSYGVVWGAQQMNGGVAVFSTQVDVPGSITELGYEVPEPDSVGCTCGACCVCRCICVRYIPDPRDDTSGMSVVGTYVSKWWDTPGAVGCSGVCPHVCVYASKGNEHPPGSSQCCECHHEDEEEGEKKGDIIILLFCIAIVKKFFWHAGVAPVVVG